MRERRKLPSVATSNLNLLFTLIPGPTRAGCYPNQDTGQDGLRHPPFAVSMPARIDGNHPICPRVTSKREPRQAFNQIPRCHDVDDVAGLTSGGLAPSRNTMIEYHSLAISFALAVGN